MIGLATFLTSGLLLTANAATPSTLDLQKDLRELQTGYLRGENPFPLLTKILPRVDGDPLARARALEFFDRSLDAGRSWERDLPADLGEVVVIFYFDRKGDRDTRSLGVFRGTPDARPWTELRLVRNGSLGTEAIDLANQAPGVWLSETGGACGSYRIAIERGIGKDSDRLEIPFILRGCGNPGEPPQVAAKWLDDKHLSLQLRRPPGPAEKFEKSDVELLVIDSRKNRPIWSALNPTDGKASVTLDRSEARHLLLYATQRYSYALLPVRVLRESRRILPLESVGSFAESK